MGQPKCDLAARVLVGHLLVFVTQNISKASTERSTNHLGNRCHRIDGDGVTPGNSLVKGPNICAGSGACKEQWYQQRCHRMLELLIQSDRQATSVRARQADHGSAQYRMSIHDASEEGRHQDDKDDKSNEILRWIVLEREYLPQNQHKARSNSKLKERAKASDGNKAVGTLGDVIGVHNIDTKGRWFLANRHTGDVRHQC